MFGVDLTQLTPEQTEEYLKQLESDKKDLENALKHIEAIEKPEEWEALKKGPNTDTIWQSGANNTFTAPYPVSGLQ